MSAAAPLLQVRDLRVRKGGAELLDLPALNVSAGETLALIGPNGAGKSTLLLALSGIEPPAAGELRFRGERVPAGAAALAYRRRVAMVFQEPLLFDTTVFENVASGLRLRGVAKAEIGRRVARTLERFNVAPLADRSARTLSGGEAQRTSLARALAVAPEVLLLDEPFAALDQQTREGLIEDLARTLRETGTTTVFATHDRTEAQRLADRIAVIAGGRLRQVGTAEAVLRRPVDATVAAFVGVENLLQVRLGSAANGGRAAAMLGEVAFEVGAVAPGMSAGAEGLLCVRPEDVLIAAACRADDPPGPNRVRGLITTVVPVGPLNKVTVDCGFAVSAAVPGHLARDLTLRPGRAVTVSLRPADLYVIPRG